MHVGKCCQERKPTQQREKVQESRIPSLQCVIWLFGVHHLPTLTTHLSRRGTASRVYLSLVSYECIWKYVFYVCLLLLLSHDLCVYICVFKLSISLLLLSCRLGRFPTSSVVIITDLSLCSCLDSKVCLRSLHVHL